MTSPAQRVPSAIAAAGFLPTALCLLLLGSCGGSSETSPESPAETANPPITDHGGGDSAGGEMAATTTAAAAPDDVTRVLGAPLASPELYYGLFAPPGDPDRAWFVTEAKRPKEAEQAPEIPPGYLMIGATFGDVAPWVFRSESATEFVQVWASDFQPEPVRVVFELDDRGAAVAMTFTDEGHGSVGRLGRTGDLPEGW